MSNRVAADLEVSRPVPGGQMALDDLAAAQNAAASGTKTTGFGLEGTGESLAGSTGWLGWSGRVAAYCLGPAADLAGLRGMGRWRAVILAAGRLWVQRHLGV